jgi:hypothetical protein
MDLSSERRRKRLFIALGVMALLLLLCVVCYRLCFPDLEAIARQRRAVLEDPDLTWEQKVEKLREIDAKLTPEQGRQVFQMDKKRWAYESNREMRRFLKMSPVEQAAYVKKRDEERKQSRPVAIKGGGGAVTANGGGNAVMAGGGGGGAGFVFFGKKPGGPGGGLDNPNQMQKTMLDDFSPETRAGMDYQRGLSK